MHTAQPDAIALLDPPLEVGERVSVRVIDKGQRTEVLGFVTALDAASLTLVDRRGATHVLGRAVVDAARRVGVATGRNPAATPRALLDTLARRAGAEGEVWLARISALLEGQTPPASVPAQGEVAVFDGVPARVEGEWVTLSGGQEATWVAAAWWATRLGARSIQVRTSDADTTAALAASGFIRMTD